jgi:hypothetical protein
MPMHYAASAAIHQLRSWVAGGSAPAHGPRYEFSGGTLALDEHGNPKGGIRLPPIDVPVARYVSTSCSLGGITVPFTDLQLLQLYGTHTTYYAEMAERTDAAVAAGWMLPEDAVDLMERVCAAAVRFPTSPPGCTPYVPPTFNQPLDTEGAPPHAPPAEGPAGGSATPTAATGPRRLPATGDEAPLVAATLALAGAAAGARLLTARPR